MALRLPEPPAVYDRTDQVHLRRLLEQALAQASTGSGGVTTGAQGPPGPAGPAGPPGTGGGGSSIARADTTFTTASLANAATENGTVALGKSGIIYAVTLSAPGRLRLYATSAERTADAARVAGEDPGFNSGLLLDLLLNTDTGLTWALSPKAVFENGDGPASTSIYYAVENLSGAAAAITVTITAVTLES